MMADAVAGGDTKKLFKMMEKGELDPNKHLPMLWDAMGKNAAPYMEQYFKSIEYARRRSVVAGEEWFKTFMEKGATQGLTDIYSAFGTVMEDAGGSAGFLGDTFYRVSNAGVAAIMGFQELKEYLSGTGREYENIFRDIFGDFVGLGNFLKMAEFEQISGSFERLFSSSSRLADSLSPLVNEVLKTTGILAKNALSMSIEKGVAVSGKTSEVVDMVSGAISGDTTSVATEIVSRRASERLVDSILTGKGINPESFDWKERNRMIEEVFPKVLEEVAKRRSEMGSFRGFIFDQIEGDAILSEIPNLIDWVTGSVLKGLADVIDVPSTAFGRGGTKTAQGIRRRASGTTYTKEELEFLQRNPQLVGSPISPIRGKSFDADVIQKNELINAINAIFSENLQLGFPSSAYQGDHTTLNRLLNLNSPYKNLGQTSYQFSVPSIEKPTLMRLSEESLLDLRSSLSPLTSGAIVQDSPEQVISQGSVYNTNNVTPTVNLSATYNIEVPNMDNIVAAIEDNNELLMTTIANEIGGLV